MIMVDRTNHTRIRNDEMKNRMKEKSSVDAEIKVSLGRSKFQGRQIFPMWMITVTIIFALFLLKIGLVSNKAQQNKYQRKAYS